MKALFDQSGRVAVVTGAGSGLGLQAAACLAELGATTFLLDLDEARLEEACAGLRSKGLPVQSRVVDVCDAAQQGAVFDEIVAAHGRLDVVMANAGVSGGRGPMARSGAIDAVDIAHWQQVLDINLTGTFKTLQCACRHMKTFKRGRVIATTSASVLSPEPFVSYSYSASKAALNATIRLLAVEMAAYGVSVNAIAPGPFVTGISGGAMADPGVQQTLSKRIALGRLGAPEDIRGLVAFLASDASSYLTGEVIALAGGYPSAPLAATAVTPQPPRPQ